MNNYLIEIEYDEPIVGWQFQKWCSVQERMKKL